MLVWSWQCFPNLHKTFVPKHITWAWKHRPVTPELGSRGKKITVQGHPWLCETLPQIRGMGGEKKHWQWKFVISVTFFFKVWKLLTWIFCTWESEAGKFLWVQGPAGLRSKSQNIWATHRNPVLKQQKPKSVYFCRYVCTSVCMPLGAHRVQKRELAPLDIVTDGWVLGIRLWGSTRSASALNLGECEVCRRTPHTPVMHSLGRVPDFRVGKLMTYVWMWHLTKMKSDFGAILGSGLGGTFGHLLEL